MICLHKILPAETSRLCIYWVHALILSQLGYSIIKRSRKEFEWNPIFFVSFAEGIESLLSQHILTQLK